MLFVFLHLFLVLVVLQVPFIALGARVKVYKQGEEENLCSTPR